MKKRRPQDKQTNENGSDSRYQNGAGGHVFDNFYLGVEFGGGIIHSRFSNMAILLILSGIMMFMLGLISEQIALLRMSQIGYFHHEDLQ